MEMNQPYTDTDNNNPYHERDPSCTDQIMLMNLSVGLFQQ